MLKKWFSPIFFSYNLPACSLSSVLKFNFLQKFCVNFFLQALFLSAQHLYEKRKGSGSRSRSISLMDPDLGGLRIRIPNTDEIHDWQQTMIKAYYLYWVPSERVRSRMNLFRGLTVGPPPPPPSASYRRLTASCRRFSSPSVASSFRLRLSLMRVRRILANLVGDTMTLDAFGLRNKKIKNRFCQKNYDIQFSFKIYEKSLSS